jgi:hypothetical protein
MLSDYKPACSLRLPHLLCGNLKDWTDFFQQTKADHHELYQQIFLHHKSLQNRLDDSKRQKKSIHQVDFCVNFWIACNKFLQQNNSAESPLEIKKMSKKGVCKFDLCLTVHLQCRQCNKIKTN